MLPVSRNALPRIVCYPRKTWQLFSRLQPKKSSNSFVHVFFSFFSPYYNPRKSSSSLRKRHVLKRLQPNESSNVRSQACAFWNASLASMNLEPPKLSGLTAPSLPSPPLPSRPGIAWDQPAEIALSFFCLILVAPEGHPVP